MEQKFERKDELPMKYYIFRVAFLHIYLPTMWHTTCMGQGTAFADPSGTPTNEEKTISFTFLLAKESEIWWRHHILDSRLCHLNFSFSQ